MHRKLSRSESPKDCMDRHPVLDGSHVPFFQSSSITEKPAATASHMKNKWRVLKECMPATSLVTRGRAIVAKSCNSCRVTCGEIEKRGETHLTYQAVESRRRPAVADRRERRVRRLVLVSLFESYVLVRGCLPP